MDITSNIRMGITENMFMIMYGAPEAKNRKERQEN